jgi:phage baseplate assembly protein W
MNPAEDTQASKLLRELDERQEHVLSELDELNARVEKVLELYLGSRFASQEPSC